MLSNLAAIAPHFSSDRQENTIEIEGWTFDLDPSTWATTGPPGLQGTTLIFKFAAGRVVDLAKDTGAWAKAAGDEALPFNVDDQATSTRVGTLIQQAIDAYAGQGDTDFATFVGRSPIHRGRASSSSTPPRRSPRSRTPGGVTRSQPR